jgi:prepilin-type N-terminal cleavage/methylation domain-containing protein
MYMRRHGFTLIELVVVIAIISVLLSISLAGIGNARVRSRDARRIADVRTIQSALEMHAFNDPSRSYPPDNANESVSLKYCLNSRNGTAYGIYQNDCFKQYLAAVPKHPDGVTPYEYYRPACYTPPAAASTAGGTMRHVDDGRSCPSMIYGAGYGLHATLEADNNEARNDASPNDPRSYDILQ